MDINLLFRAGEMACGRVLSVLPEEKIKVLDDRIILQYQKDYSVYLDLTVINDKGLEAFSYKKSV